MNFWSRILFNVLSVIEARRVDYIEMKMKSMNNRYLTSMVCLVFSLGIGISSLASVVCIGDDGHVKMEVVCQPCCSEPVSQCSLDESESETDHHDCCGNCTDLPLLQDPLFKRLSSEYQPDEVAAISVLAVSCFPVDVRLTIDTRPPRVEKSPLNKGPGLLSTTILIC
jgi:hypothetical protein